MQPPPTTEKVVEGTAAKSAKKKKKRNRSKEVKSMVTNTLATNVVSEEATETDQIEDSFQKQVNEGLALYKDSLQYFFYLEYKSKFPETQRNPIVYSKYGKQCYGSKEKWNSKIEDFMIRTCNLKRTLRLNSTLNAKGERRFLQPV